jgi:hypothetical protein
MAAILPETWLPTVTLTTALSVPLAVTYCASVPRATGSVPYFKADAPGLQPAKTTSANPAQVSGRTSWERMPVGFIKCGFKLFYFQPPPRDL